MTRRAYFRYGSNVVEIGRITGLSDNITTSTMAKTARMPMLRVEDQYNMDTGSTESITVTATHINGEDGLTNREWMESLEALMNRWQAETNGCRFVFQYDSTDDLYNIIPRYNSVNCFISRLVFKWGKILEEIVATIELKVGSMMGGDSVAEDTPMKGTRVRMTDQNNNWYEICNFNPNTDEWVTAIESLSLTGGFDQPFESVRMKLPRRRLEEISPTFLQDNGISIGKNVVRLSDNYGGDPIGYGDFIVSAVKTEKTNYTVDAVSVAELFKKIGTAVDYGLKRTVQQSPVEVCLLGVSIPTEINYDNIGAPENVVAIYYYNEYGTRVTVYLNKDVKSIVVRCKKDTSCLIYAWEGQTFKFTEWSDGSSSIPKYVQMDESKSFGSTWEEFGLDSYTSVPPSVPEGIQLADTDNESWSDPTGVISHPLDIIEDILYRGVEYRAYDPERPGRQTVNMYYMTGNSPHEGKLYLHTSKNWSSSTYNWSNGNKGAYFPAGTNAWYVLQICAYYLGAKIHFSDNDCYITDMDYASVSDPNIDFSANGSDYLHLLGVPTLGSSKAENVVNVINYKYGASDTYVSPIDQSIHSEVRYTDGVARDDSGTYNSVKTYGAKMTQKTLYGIRNSTNANKIAMNIIRFHRAGGQAITVSLIEADDGSWVSRFGSECYPKTIYEATNDVQLSCGGIFGESSTTYTYPALGLREYERQLPQCVTKYTFGPQNPTNLALKVSQIEDSINNQ